MGTIRQLNKGNGMTAGDAVSVRIAKVGGYVWMRGTIAASYPAQFRTRRFDVNVEGHVYRNVSELSLRAERRAA